MRFLRARSRVNGDLPTRLSRTLRVMMTLILGADASQETRLPLRLVGLRRRIVRLLLRIRRRIIGLLLRQCVGRMSARNLRVCCRSGEQAKYGRYHQGAFHVALHTVSKRGR